MTLHLGKVEKPRIKADTRALKSANENIHFQLRREIEQDRASKPRSVIRRIDPYYIR